MSKALLICNADRPGKWLKKYAAQADFILAADGGANAALAAGITPDAVIGDFDSVSSRTRRTLKEVPFIHVTRQDNTDLEKALDWLTAQSFDECMIAGATGGRLDFTLGNILAARPYLKKIKVTFVGKDWTLFFLTRSYSFSARKGARCSFIALTSCRNVTLKGLTYKVTNETWNTQRIGRTLSNEISSAKSEISFSDGVLLMYLEK